MVTVSRLTVGFVIIILGRGTIVPVQAVEGWRGGVWRIGLEQNMWCRRRIIITDHQRIGVCSWCSFSVTVALPHQLESKVQE